MQDQKQPVPPSPLAIELNTPVLHGGYEVYLVVQAANTGFAFLLDRQAGNVSHAIGGR